jgi:hypothetical protein
MDFFLKMAYPQRVRKNLFFLSFVVFLFSSWTAGAQETAVEQQFHEKALKRQYPGGRDEEDLKVMSQVPDPVVKVSKRTVEGQVLKSMSGQSSEPQD